MSGGSGYTAVTEVLDEAAGKISSIAEDGMRTPRCQAWGSDYGHGGLASAVTTFARDVDQAVTQHCEAADAMTGTLRQAAAAYRAADLASQQQFCAPAAPFAGIHGAH